MNTLRTIMTFAGAALATFLLGMVAIRVQPHSCLACGPGDHVAGYHLDQTHDTRTGGDPDTPSYRLSVKSHGVALFKVSDGAPHYKCWNCRRLWLVRSRTPGAILSKFVQRLTP